MGFFLRPDLEVEKRQPPTGTDRPETAPRLKIESSCHAIDDVGLTIRRLRRTVSDLLSRAENPDGNWQRRSRRMLHYGALMVGMDVREAGAKTAASICEVKEGIGAGFDRFPSAETSHSLKNAEAFPQTAYRGTLDG
jgi:hypothetical protein